MTNADERPHDRPGADDLEELVRRAQQEARRARDDAQRAKEEAMKLRDEARNLARRIRNEARDDQRRSHDERRQARDAMRHHMRGFSSQHWGPHHEAPSAGKPDAEWDGAKGDHAKAFADARQVAISQSAGKLRIQPCTAGEAPSVRTWGGNGAPRLEIAREGDRVKIDIHVPRGWLFRRGNPAATTEVRLPATEFDSLSVNMGAGELWMTELHAKRADLHVGAGTESTTALSGDLRASIGAGRLSIGGHRGLVRCSAGTGNVSLDLAELAAGEYTVNAGVGRAEVRIPAGRAVTFKSNKGLGRTRIDYPDAGESAPTSFRLDAGVGEVVVKARREGEGGTDTTSETRSRPAPVSRRRETDELRILEMLEQGKINSREAAELIAALHGSPSASTDSEPGS